MATVYSPIKDLTADELQRVTEVTYLGAVNGTMAALRRMTSGTIVQVSSVLAWRAIPIQGAYCGAKFALRGFTEALRSELIHDSSPLHLTMVHLPAVNTPQFDWARNKTGRQTKAPGPYQPEVAARRHPVRRHPPAARRVRRQLHAAHHPGRPPGAGRARPGAGDQGLRRAAGRRADAPSDGNLFDPAPGADQAARGRFDAEANSKRDIYTSRQADAVAAGVLLLGAIGIKALLTSPLFVGPAIGARALARATVRHRVGRF